MTDDGRSVQILPGQITGPGVKGCPGSSWQTVEHKDLSAPTGELKWYKLAQAGDS